MVVTVREFNKESPKRGNYLELPSHFVPVPEITRNWGPHGTSPMIAPIELGYKGNGIGEYRWL
jgi:hypothetical protein